MRKSIAQKNMLVLIFSFIPFMVGLGYSVYTSSERIYLSTAINMAGAQRMRTMLLANYSQQIHYAYMVGYDASLQRGVIERELATYRQFFDALQHGDAGQNILKNPFPRIVDTLALMNQDVNEYVANVEHILKNPRHADTVQNIISSALAIRDDFHEVTEQYQSMNDLMIRRQKAVDISMLVFAALVTVSGLFLTRKIRVQEQRLFAATEEAEAAIRAKNDFLANQNEQLAREVQERLETEKALRLSEEKFRMVADNVPGVIYLCKNDERWSMLYLNDKVELLTGYPKEEFLENRISFADIYHPDDRSSVQEEIDLALSRKEPFHIQFRFRHKNGEWKWAEESGVGVYENNRISMLEGVMMDITERKRAETILRESEERFRALTENLPLGMVMMDRKRRVLHANPVMREWFPDADFDSAPACYCSMHNPPLNMASDECPVARTLATGESHTGERTTLIHGQERRLSMLSSPIRDESGCVVAVMEVLEDITERKQAEAEMERLNEQMREAMSVEAHQAGKLETATGILHDIGNAITGLGAVFVDYRECDDWPETERLERLLSMIRTSEESLDTALGEGKGTTLCAYMEKLIGMLNERADRQRAATDRAQAIISHISSILDMQRVYALSGAVGIRGPVCLGTLMDDALNMMATSLQKRGIQVDRRYTSADGSVSGDQTALIQVFINLLKNACEAFDQDDLPKQRVLRIDMTAGSSDEYCQVVLTDNACGFSAEAKGRLFERMYTTKPQGAGIGLPFVKGVMQSHGGRIIMDSAGPGTGAQVTLELPVKTDKPLS